MPKKGDKIRRDKGKDMVLGDYYTAVNYPTRLREMTPVLSAGVRVLLIMGGEVSDELKVDQNSEHIYVCKVGV